MMVKPLGKLQRVEVREVWLSEANGFTPWLAEDENIAILSESIGIELEVEAQEKQVGPFRADILCKDTATGSWVLIENQLERTDHLHLGQLLTYAAGLQAVTIVWIAKQFTEEHRATLDWLNEITDERFNFFGLEIELWRIGDSPVAPKFNIICKPNDWSKTVAAGAAQVEHDALTDAKRLQLEFWEQFRKYADEHAERIRPIKAQPQHWMNIALGRMGFKLAAVASHRDSVAESYDSHELRAEVVLDSDSAKMHFAQLEAQRPAIEIELGEALTWHNPPDANMCRMYLRKSVNLTDRTAWSACHTWLVEKLDKLHKVFAPRIKLLSANGPTSEVMAGIPLTVLKE